MSPQGLFFLLFFCYLSLSHAAIPTYSLSDKQIIGGSTVQLLNGKWDAFSPSQNIKISGNVPGDIASDLYLAGIIPDPISDINFITYGPIWAKHLWTYNTTFSLNSQDISNLESSAGDILLVFDGIKMGANIYINNYLIDTSISQFLRLNFSLSAYQQQTKALVAGENYLSVVFDPLLKTHGLFAQCSGGWDWAPYTQLESSDGFNIFSLGIWKDVYLVWVPWVAIVDTVVHTYYTGPFQTTALQAGKHSPFEVSVSLFTYNYLTTPISNVVLQVLPSWLNGQAAIKTTVEILPGYNKLVVPAFNATADEIQLWWPSGYGSQPLYNIQVTLTNPSTSSQLVDARNIGFRVAHMTTGNDTNPNYVQSNTNTDGSDSFGLMWRINGQAIYNRGANVIPMSDMEGRYNAFAHRQMVLSARDGMMNTLRIWGGGVYLPQIFYDTCDEVGIMVLHDMMNRGSWIGIPEETYAYLHQTRRLSYHPSIIVWNGCNECRGQNNVVPYTVTVVAREDPSRVIWPSCPADGWKTGVERLTGLPNGNPLAMSPADSIEVHGPYQHGAGWPAVNGDYEKLDLFDPMTPPQEYPSNRIGLGQPNTFTSEFGTATWSSFESVSATLSNKYWSLHGGVLPDTCTGSWNNNCTGGNPLSQRNYPCDNIYVTYYGENSLKELDQVGESAFKQQLFKCVIGSALVMKAYIEETRSRNCFGTLVWQLNEIWPTGGWGSIEYGSEAPGQVLGGRWKPTHYWMRKSLFTDILIACGVDGKLGSFLWCYVKNDSPNAVSGTLSFSAVEFSDASSVTTVYSNTSFSLASGPDTQQWFKVNVNFNPSASLLEAQYTSDNNETMSYNNMLLSPPSDLTGVGNFSISLSVSSSPNPDQSVDITLTKTSPALGLYVTLTTAAQGRFSDNSFIMTTNSIIVQYIPFGDLDLDILASTIRVEHLGNYL